MSAENLKAYMQDHAAGASAGLDLLGHLISSHADSDDEVVLKDLRGAIEEDKAMLDELLGRFQATESAVLNALSRVGEKAARAKFLLAGPGSGALGRLEALEMMSLGIEGKRVLWLALENARIPELAGVDFAALARSAAAPTRNNRSVATDRRKQCAQHGDPRSPPIPRRRAKRSYSRSPGGARTG